MNSLLTTSIITHPELKLWPEVRAMRACLRHREFPPALLLSFHEAVAGMRPQIFALLENELKSGAAPAGLHFFRGLVHERQGAHNEALAEYQAALRGPDLLDWQPLWRSFFILSQFNQTEAAVQCAAEMLRRRPDLPWAGTLAEKLQLPGYSRPAGGPRKVRVPPQPRLLIYYTGFKSFSKVGGGSEAALVDFARIVKASGAFSAVHCCGDLSEQEEELDGLKLCALPAAAPQLSAFLDSYDVVVFISSLQRFKEVEKSPGKTWILYCHCWDIANEELFRLGDFDLVFALSALQKNHFADRGIEPERIPVIPNHIDTGMFRPLPLARNPYALMFCGAVVPHKRVHLLLQAFFALKSEFPALELDVYGSSALWRDPDEYEKTLQRFASESVRFRGAVARQELPQVYATHGVLCLPSELESFSLVSVEAQACGCIPVLHAAGGTGATVINEMTGFLYEPNNVETLTAALRKAIQQTVSNPAMREKAAAFAAGTFSLERGVACFKSLLADHFVQG